MTVSNSSVESKQRSQLLIIQAHRLVSTRIVAAILTSVAEPGEFLDTRDFP